MPLVSQQGVLMKEEKLEFENQEEEQPTGMVGVPAGVTSSNII
jgi:hypothetical protein